MSMTMHGSSAMTRPSSPTSDDKYDLYVSKGTPFLLADIGEGIAEVELLQWFKYPNDNTSQFD